MLNDIEFSNIENLKGTNKMVEKTSHCRQLKCAAGSHEAIMPLKANAFRYMLNILTVQGFRV